MNLSGIAKNLAAWFVMLVVSIANGAARDFTYGKHMSELAAHQLSTVTSVILLGAIIWGFVRFFPPSSRREALCIGLFWMFLTIVFEFLFFHFVGEYSWGQLFANYNILKGRIWVIVLAWVAVAPYIFVRVRNLA